MGLDMLFQNWSGLGRTVLVGTLAYLGLIALLRVSGKRTLSKMNAFDLVVTVALGSTLATIILSERVALAEGIMAFAVLIGMQLAISWLSVRSETVGRLVKAEPALLLYQGRLLRDRMRLERVTEEEVLAAVRDHGLGSLDAVDAVVLETDGTFTVVASAGHAATSTLRSVSGPPSP